MLGDNEGANPLSQPAEISMDIFSSTATEQFPAIHGKGSLPTKFPCMQWFYFLIYKMSIFTS
jgi:hypothetical protein